MGDEQVAVTEQKSAKRAAMRRATMQLIIGVALLDSAAMGVFYLFFKDAPSRQRLFFTVAWTVATAIVVGVLLKRVRKARFAKY